MQNFTPIGKTPAEKSVTVHIKNKQQTWYRALYYVWRDKYWPNGVSQASRSRTDKQDSVSVALRGRAPIRILHPGGTDPRTATDPDPTLSLQFQSRNFHSVYSSISGCGTCACRRFMWSS